MMCKTLLPSQSIKSAVSFCQDPWGLSWLFKGSAGSVGDIVFGVIVNAGPVKESSGYELTPSNACVFFMEVMQE